MRNLRLHPNYHQYSRLKGNVPRIVEARGYPNYQQYHFLDDQAQALLGKAEEHDLVVLISIGVEDPRFAHWLMKVPSVTMIDAAEAVNGFPGVRFLVCGATFSEVRSLWSSAYHQDNLYFENSRVQGPIGDVDDLCALMGADHLLFGTNLPINYAESAKLSIEYADVGDDAKAGPVLGATPSGCLASSNTTNGLNVIVYRRIAKKWLRKEVSRVSPVAKTDGVIRRLYQKENQL